MNYIGSKHSLLAQIRQVLADHGLDRQRGTFLDAFAGTTIVGQMAKSLGFSTISNDIQTYSFVLQNAFLVQDRLPSFAGLLPEIAPPLAVVERFLGRTRPFGLARATADAWLRPDTPLVRVLAYLDALPGTDGPFVEAYCEGGAAGRNYFSFENGRRCQAIRDTLDAWLSAGLIDRGEFHLLLSSLLESLDQVANTASVYAAFLKHLKKTARQPLSLRIPAPVPGWPGTTHQAFNLEIRDLGNALRNRRVDVLYLDPPYNQRQYNAYYHILETVARWDLGTFEPRGKTGLRPDGGQNSRFCSRPLAAAALEDLLDRLPAEHVVMSYSNEGLIPEAVLRGILGSRAARTDFRQVSYRRFRADVDSDARTYRGDEVREFLFYAWLPARKARKAPIDETARRARSRRDALPGGTRAHALPR